MKKLLIIAVLFMSAMSFANANVYDTKISLCDVNSEFLESIENLGSKPYICYEISRTVVFDEFTLLTTTTVTYRCVYYTLN